MSRQNNFAPRPPMGWNSWDCYGGSVNENDVKAQADYMSGQLAEYGWQYIVIDAEWYFDEITYGGGGESQTDGKKGLNLDAYGRLIPSAKRFPSGFRKLADYIHNKGLKFGIHLMRGVPRQAVAEKCKIVGSSQAVDSIADQTSTCKWCDLTYGVDMVKDGAREYYKSVIDLCAEWGVDFIKYDDIASPYYGAEVEAIYNAIQQCGRDIVFSLSPGNNSDISHIDHLKDHCEMWRITGDIWDFWWGIKLNFERLPAWVKHGGAGHWPDADMLPLGRIGIRTHHSHGPDHMTHLSKDEQLTLMTLWCMARSPLMFGGDLPSNDEWTLGLLTNRDVIDIDQRSCNNREIYNQDNKIIWSADAEEATTKYVALFNVDDENEQEITVSFADLGISTSCQLQDLWQQKDIGTFEKCYSAKLKPHATQLLKLSID